MQLRTHTLMAPKMIKQINKFMFSASYFRFLQIHEGFRKLFCLEKNVRKRYGRLKYQP